jgi:mRNA-degrading endonuclease RelE of RelBE toxin-antitoxin system
MPYNIILAPEAVEDLQRFSAHIRAIIRAALATHLRHEPTRVSKSRIKRLRGLARPQYRLRIDEIRVFYDVHGADVEVLAIIEKSAAAVWLSRYGASDETDPTLGSQE